MKTTIAFIIATALVAISCKDNSGQTPPTPSTPNSVLSAGTPTTTQPKTTTCPAGTTMQSTGNCVATATTSTGTIGGTQGIVTGGQGATGTVNTPGPLATGATNGGTVSGGTAGMWCDKYKPNRFYYCVSAASQTIATGWGWEFIPALNTKASCVVRGSAADVSGGPCTN